MAEPYCTSTEDAKRRAKECTDRLVAGTVPTSPEGLPDGGVYSDNGFLKIKDGDGYGTFEPVLHLQVGDISDTGTTFTTGGTISSGDLLWTSDRPYTINYDWISSPKSGIVLKQENKMGVYRVYAVDRKKGSHSLLSFGEFVARNAENAKMAAVAQLGCNASSEDLDGDLSNVTDFDRWHWHAEKVFEFDVLDD